MANLMQQDQPARSPSPESDARGTGKRLDIQGLRAIAVLAVVIDHVGAFHLPGGFVGVDIFFVISGFLITSHLVRTSSRQASVGFLEFYANRVRRLLPAATAVLLFTMVAIKLWLPSTRSISFGWDVVGSALYAENWVLAGNSVDYMTQDSLASPLQHFWSLAVEEQFYIVWPVVIGLVTATFIWARRFQHGRRRQTPSAVLASHPNAFRGALLAGLLIIAAPSFAWSIDYTHTHPQPAYFVTTTRLWELAVGGIIAVAAPWITRALRPAVASVLAWVGIAGIAVSLFVITSSTPFPGFAAALPTLATAAVIAAGLREHPHGPGTLLAWRPIQLVGDMSYSIYLWHWPLIVIVLAQWGHIGMPVAILLVVASLAVGYASYRWIETPTRSADWWRFESLKSLEVGGALAASVAFIAMLFVVMPAQNAQDQAHAAQEQVAAELDAPTSSSLAQSTVKYGAEVLPANPQGAAAGEARDHFDTLVPSPSAALTDVVSCATTSVSESDVVSCPFGTPGAKVNVALVGDSHAAQWLAALKPIAEEHGWTLTAYIHDSCAFAKGPLVRSYKRYDACIAWNRAVSAKLLADPTLTAIITSNYTASVSVRGGTMPGMAGAYDAAWKPFTAKGIPVVVIRDTPEPKTVNVAECAALHIDQLTKCAFSRKAATATQGVAQMLAASQLHGVYSVDLDDAICPDDPCAPAIGNVLIYRDTNHLTGTYVATLRPRLEPMLLQIPALAGKG